MSLLRYPGRWECTGYQWVRISPEREEYLESLYDAAVDGEIEERLLERAIKKEREKMEEDFNAGIERERSRAEERYVEERKNRD